MLIFASVLGCKRRTVPTHRIVVVIESQLRSLDPRTIGSSHDYKLSQLVAPGLMSVDNPRLEPKLRLASHAEQIDDVTWEMTLRPDARFSDGSPVMAEDVVFSFQWMIDTGRSKSFTEKFAAIEAVSPKRIRFSLHYPVATFLSDMEFGIVKAGATNAEGLFAGGKVVGAGPWQIASISPRRALLVRNPHYFDKLPETAASELEVKVVAEEHTIGHMLVGGSADLAQNSIRPDLTGVVAENDSVKLQAGPSAILTYLMMNNEHDILKNRLVRQAIAHGIDRKEIISRRFGGRAVLATGLLPPAHWAYNGNVSRYDYNPEKAKALLDEAGYPDPDGEGGTPRFTLTYKTSASSFRVDIARTIAVHLGRIGIEVKVRPFEFHTFFRDIKKGNYELGAMQTSPITEPDYYYAYYHSSRIPTADNLRVMNRWRFRNEEFDTLAARGRRVSDREQRTAIYGRIQEILANELPVVPLWHEDNVALTSKNVVGYDVMPTARFWSLAKAGKQP